MLKEDSRIQNMGIYQSVGMTEQKNGITMGIVCSDETTMQLSNITLVEGRMPQAADELLVREVYLYCSYPDGAPVPVHVCPCFPGNCR